MLGDGEGGGVWESVLNFTEDTAQRGRVTYMTNSFEMSVPVNMYTLFLIDL